MVKQKKMGAMADTLDYNFQQIQRGFYKMEALVDRLNVSIKNIEKRLSKLEK